MGRVLRSLQKAGTSLDVGTVHRLRVSLRRCLSFAVLMEEVDPHPAWKDVRQLSRHLFRRLGGLRDTQVLERWVRKLTTADDAARAALLLILEQRAREHRARARRAVSRFDRQRWKRLASTLAPRAKVVVPDGLAAHGLALRRYEALQHAHRRAVRSTQSALWHQLRVSLKRFRYAVESLLPAPTALWEEGLRETQDLLGEIHDLDILDGMVVQETTQVKPGAAALRQALDHARRHCRERYRVRTEGPTGLLHAWRAGLPHGEKIDAAALALLRVTARTLDPHPRDTTRIARLAARLFDVLLARRRSAARSNSMRGVLHAAALLHNLHCPSRKTSRQKAASQVLGAMPVPPGWTRQDWEVLTQAVRYHRGAEPTPTRGRFARMPKSRQSAVRGLAGVLRVARALDDAGASTPAHVRTELTPGGVRIRVAGLITTPEHTRHIAAAAHMLEVHLRRRLLIESLDEFASQRSPARHSRQTDDRITPGGSRPW